jgi:hypothetical protein
MEPGRLPGQSGDPVERPARLPFPTEAKQAPVIDGEGGAVGAAKQHPPATVGGSIRRCARTVGVRTVGDRQSGSVGGDPAVILH